MGCIGKGEKFSRSPGRPPSSVKPTAAKPRSSQDEDSSTTFNKPSSINECLRDTRGDAYRTQARYSATFNPTSRLQEPQQKLQAKKPARLMTPGQQPPPPPVRIMLHWPLLSSARVLFTSAISVFLEHATRGYHEMLKQSHEILQ